MTPAQRAVEVYEVNDSEIRSAIALVLAEAGIEEDALLAQARAGRFESEAARLAWFAISPFLDARRI